jgi:hypothetical protein
VMTSTTLTSIAASSTVVIASWGLSLGNHAPGLRRGQ